MSYTAPVKDIAFLLNNVIGLADIAELDGFEEVSPELIEAILEESAKFTADVLAPLNWIGDQQGSQLADGVVTTPDGWKDAYSQFVENGWGSLSAEPSGDHYLIKGQKIYITYGEHDLTENIIHMVLARLPDAPEGVKGISLFIVPKFLVNDDGTLGKRNDVTCISLEHKLGIHASPTCVMSYGDNDGAVGYLVGKEHHGLAYMFTMMNQARHAVGVEGYGIAERAYQKAVSYARERKQGKTLLGKDAND